MAASREYYHPGDAFVDIAETAEEAFPDVDRLQAFIAKHSSPCIHLPAIIPKHSSPILNHTQPRIKTYIVTVAA